MPTTSELFAEVFAEYALSILALLLRFYARAKFFGIRNFDVGDICAAFATIFYSLEVSGIYLLTEYGNNIGLDEQSALEVPDDQVARLALGSKLAFINWIWYINLLWCLKGVLLTIYVKLGTGIARQERFVQATCVFTALCWLASILTHILGCTPPSKGWQIKPYAGDNCSTRPINYIVIAILNALSDMAIVLVPMPLLWKVNVPLKQKLVLMALFSMGFFVISATVLRSYYSLKSLDTLPIALQWASRETWIATIVACAPGIKPLISRNHWYRGSSKSSRKNESHDIGKYDDFSLGKLSAKDNTIVVQRTVDITHQKCEGKVKEEFDIEFENWMRPEPSKSSRSEDRPIIDDDDEVALTGHGSSPRYFNSHLARTKDQV